MCCCLVFYDFSLSVYWLISVEIMVYLRTLLQKTKPLISVFQKITFLISGDSLNSSVIVFLLCWSTENVNKLSMRLTYDNRADQWRQVACHTGVSFLYRISQAFRLNQWCDQLGFVYVSVQRRNYCFIGSGL